MSRELDRKVAEILGWTNIKDDDIKLTGNHPNSSESVRSVLPYFSADSANNQDMLDWLAKPDSFVTIYTNCPLQYWNDVPFRTMSEWSEYGNGYTKRRITGRGITIQESLANLVVAVKNGEIE